MTEIQSSIVWERGAAQFIDGKYSRAHSWSFDGGAVVPASSSPHIVPLPFSIESAVDPEEAFVASLSSCHMLWFLSIAAKRGLRVNFYRDVAVGEDEPRVRHARRRAPSPHRQPLTPSPSSSQPPWQNHPQ